MRQLPPLDPGDLPVAAGAIKCGNRTELPRKQRVHDKRDAGLDVRHMGDGSYQTVQVLICIRCGTDEYHRIEAA